MSLSLRRSYVVLLFRGMFTTSLYDVDVAFFWYIQSRWQWDSFVKGRCSWCLHEEIEELQSCPFMITFHFKDQIACRWETKYWYMVKSVKDVFHPLIFSTIGQFNDALCDIQIGPPISDALDSTVQRLHATTTYSVQEDWLLAIPVMKIPARMWSCLMPQRTGTGKMLLLVVMRTFSVHCTVRGFPGLILRL